MADTFALEVVTPERVLVAAAATAVSLRTSGGSMTVLAGHAAFVGDLISSEVRVDRVDEEPLRMAIHGGYVQVDTGRGAVEGVAGVGDGPISGVSTRVTLVVGVAELATDIDVPRAEAAKADAQSRLDALRAGASRTDSSEEARIDLDVQAAEADLARAELRLQVAGVSVS
ncbi:MAG: hypothetical protein WCJ42_09625 [Actinomycetes bacterium]